MKHCPDLVYGRSRSLFMRRQTLQPLIVREAAKTTQLESAARHVQSSSTKKSRDCSPVRKSNTTWQNKSDGGITLPKVSATTSKGTRTSFATINSQQNQKKDADDRLQDRAQLRRMQRIEIYALNKIMTQMELNQFRNFCKDSGLV